MRIVVTGREGQVARALLDAAGPAGVEVIAVGRPDMDLADPASVRRAVLAAHPDAVVSAAAYTAVDRAEAEPDLAHAVNALGAQAVAEAAREAGAPLVHLSTDYVFDGRKAISYVETDATSPLGVYGRTKLEGEGLVAAAQPDHVVLRVAWVYGVHGGNFVKTMLRVAAQRDMVRVVDDQIGRPTAAADIASVLIALCSRLRAHPDQPELRGLFHLAPQGSASWADVAEAVFARSHGQGGPWAQVERIATVDYPTPAARPANSRLDGALLGRLHGLSLPSWTDSLDSCVDQLLAHP